MPPRSPVLVTGAAGFIGFHVSKRLLDEGRTVVGLDNLNDYYDPSLKQARLGLLNSSSGFRFEKADIEDEAAIHELFERERPFEVVHLAAQAGVRYSLENPLAYARTNVVGFLNILEACRSYPVKHLIAASSSSVYGSNEKLPYSESDNVDHPVSLYAATKKADELMAHVYSHLFGVPITCLRFFTVYGPWGRPDMAYFSFTKAIVEGRPIEVFNEGKLKRDFTYIDDIVEGVLRVMARRPDTAPFAVYNIGNHEPVELMRFIETLEELIGKRAQKKMLPMQPGDVFETYADIDRISEETGFKPTTSLKDGLRKFVDWYRDYYLV